MFNRYVLKIRNAWDIIKLLFNGSFVKDNDLAIALNSIENKLASKFEIDLNSRVEQIINDNRCTLEQSQRSELRLDFLQDLLRQHALMTLPSFENFENALRHELLIGLLSEFRDNFDPFLGETIDSIQQEVNAALVYYRRHFDGRIDQLIAKLPMEKLNKLHATLADVESQQLLAKLIAYRQLGLTKIRLRSAEETELDRNFYNSLQKLVSVDNPPFRSGKFEVQCYDLRPLGWHFRCYTIPFAINVEFRNLQYANAQVQVNQGDWVLDCGACWGDTSLWFADQVGPSGRVFCFEFIPSNLDIFCANAVINPELSKCIELVKHPVAARPGNVIRCQDNGAASTFKIAQAEDADASCIEAVTVSIDDWVERCNPEKIDFIKMDIEGSELDALHGAAETLKRYRPKLAIAIYHRPEDIYQIPDFLMSLNLGYRCYFKHPTAEGFETVMLATAEFI